MAPTPADQRVHDDGRVELGPADVGTLEGSRFFNEELAPVPVEKRTWTTYNYFALWMGMAHNIPSYALAASLIALGMNWVQALLTITIGNLVVLAPMLLNSHAGTKYGIPFPVFARAIYGLRGANLAAQQQTNNTNNKNNNQTKNNNKTNNVILGRLLGAWWRDAPE